jgi:hypothetical protein
MACPWQGLNPLGLLLRCINHSATPPLIVIWVGVFHCDIYLYDSLHACPLRLTCVVYQLLWYQIDVCFVRIKTFLLYICLFRHQKTINDYNRMRVAISGVDLTIYRMYTKMFVYMLKEYGITWGIYNKLLEKNKYRICYLHWLSKSFKK